MRVLVAGGSGAIGRQLVPLLIAEGHEAAATARSSAKLKDIGPRAPPRSSWTGSTLDR